MTTQLRLYNAALTICEASEISGLTVNELGRRLLDSVWNNGGVRYCLEQGQWKFAMRAAQLDYDTAFTPEFGYQRAFAKPSDWVATSAICTDEYFNSPLTQYTDEGGFWYCDHDELYVRYVSDHADYGGDLTIWPQTFADYVAAHFAWRIVRKMPGGAERYESVEKQMKEAKSIAKNKDAMAGPTTFPVRGSWVRARGGSGRGDGGNRNGNLIG